MAGWHTKVTHLPRATVCFLLIFFGRSTPWFIMTKSSLHLALGHTDVYLCDKKLSKKHLINPCQGYSISVKCCATFESMLVIPPNKTISLHDFWNKLVLSICCRMTNYKGKQFVIRRLLKTFRSGQTDIKVYHRLLHSYIYMRTHRIDIRHVGICLYTVQTLTLSGQLMTD